MGKRDWAAVGHLGVAGLPWVALAGGSFLPHWGYRVALIVVLWLFASALELRVTGVSGQAARVSPLRWLRHDRVGRGRAVLLVVVAVGAVGWAVLAWPEWGFPAGALGLAVVLVALDYCLSRYAVRRARRAAVGAAR
ncbi:hypothetical protein ACIQMJ_14525 [Actinosynnema sp. NPDC091369]